MTVRSVEIELARSQDIPSIALLARDEIEHGLGWRYRPEAVRGLLHDPDTVVLVARRSEPESAACKVVGFAVMTYDALEAHLKLLAVSPEHRRQGIARSLLSWVEKTALFAGVQRVYLEVRQENAPALTFYESAGFERIELVQNYYRGPGGRSENAWRMHHVLVETEAPNQGLQT
ncbi:MAG: N-acetyltransferase [Gammaproteobacteria bacterium]|nr:N-acetyltransferase [Gammaproteobacteria bacterium]